MMIERQTRRARPLIVLGGSCLAVGLVVGTLLPRGPLRSLQAGGGDRPDAALATTVPISTEYDPNLQIQVATDGVYYLNYSKGRLLAAVPLRKQTASSTQLLSDFAETDLVRDFQLAPGTNPHFIMTSGAHGALSENRGGALLYVFETTTGQLGIYRLEQRAVANSTVPTLQLIECKRDPRLAHAPATAPAPSR